MATPTMTLQLDPVSCASASAEVVLYASTTGSAAGIATASGVAVAGVRKDSARPTRTVTDGVLASNTTVTSATAAFTQLDVGRGITGTGVPADTYVVSVESATSVTISAAATATGTGRTLTFGTVGLLVFRNLNPNDGSSDDVIDDPTGTVWRIVVKPNSSSPTQQPRFFEVPDVAGFHRITDYPSSEPGALPAPGNTFTSMDGDVGGTVGANTINDAAVDAPKIAEANVTAPKLVVEDEDGLIFSFDPSDLADSDTLPAPFVDFHAIAGLELLEDALGIRDGRLAQIQFQGANYPGPPLVSGWRGGAYIDTPLSDGFEVEVVWDPTNPNAIMGALACFDATDDDHGMGNWIVEALPFLSWFELGTINRDPGDFTYLDTCPHDLTAVLAQDEVVIKMRVLHGWCWVLVDDVRVGGPVPVPDQLRGRRQHGVQTDYLDDTAGTPGVSVTVRRYDGPVALDYPPASITGGAAGKGNGTSRSVAIPDGAQIGDVMVLFTAGTPTVTTPSGWSVEALGSTSSGGFALGCYTRTVTGAEAWFGLTGQSLSVAHTSGDLAAQMCRVADANGFQPFAPAAAADVTSNTSATVPAGSIYGRHRASLAAVAVPADRTVTFPSGWSSVSSTPGGGVAVTLAVAKVTDWDGDTPPSGLASTEELGRPRTTGTQTATLSSASTSLASHMIVLPDPRSADV